MRSDKRMLWRLPCAEPHTWVLTRGQHHHLSHQISRGAVVSMHMGTLSLPCQQTEPGAWRLRHRQVVQLPTEMFLSSTPT